VAFFDESMIGIARLLAHKQNAFIFTGNDGIIFILCIPIHDSNGLLGKLYLFELSLKINFE
jgi:hypothetical protein